jgi:dTDP-4-amino-4,6-dideoxygalactose transaminase
VSVAAPRLRLSPPLTPAVHARRRAGDLPFPLDDPRCSLFARARHALWFGVRALGLRPGDEVLAPAYHCGSEIEALAQAGLSCRFYEATDTLEPDRQELEALLSPRTRALFLIHYFGFPQDATGWRRWCDERELFLLEDCAPAWLASLHGRSLGSFGDLAIFSLHKTFPLPDGAALLLGSSVPRAPARRARGLGWTAKGHAKWLMARSGRLERLLAPLERDSLDDLTLGDPHSEPSAATRFLLPRVVERAAAERRRANYRRLLDEFAEHVPAPFATLPDGACPLIFPVERRGQDDLAERLERRNVMARPYWPVLHPLLPYGEFPGAAAWHRRFIALPVHHELRTSDLARLVGALRQSLTGS